MFLQARLRAALALASHIVCPAHLLAFCICTSTHSTDTGFAMSVMDEDMCLQPADIMSDGH